MIEVVKNINFKNCENKIYEWFDREIAEKLSIRDKFFKKFKSSRLNVDWEIYKEAKNDVQRTIKQKKKQYLEEKLSEKIAKPKQLWQTLISLGLSNKKNSPSNICSKKQKWFVIESLSIAETFKKYYSSLAENLGIQSVNNYYKKCNLKERLLFAKIESDKVFKILKKFDESKAPCIDDLSESF